MLTGIECEMTEWSSNSAWICYIHFCINDLKHLFPFMKYMASVNRIFRLTVKYFKHFFLKQFFFPQLNFLRSLTLIIVSNIEERSHRKLMILVLSKVRSYSPLLYLLFKCTTHFSSCCCWKYTSYQFFFICSTNQIKDCILYDFFKKTQVGLSTSMR